MLATLCLMLSAPADLEQTFQTYLNEEFKLHPTYATAMGNHDYDDQMDDLSNEFHEKQVERLKSTIARVEAMDSQQWNAATRIDHKIWLHSLKQRLWQHEHDNRFVNDPRVYIEYASGSVYTLLTQSTLPRERNVANAAKRIGFVPNIIEAAKANLRNPAKILTEVAIAQTSGAIAFYEKDIYAISGELAATSELRKPCEAAVAALKEYQRFLKEDLLSKSNGEWRLGRKKFAEKLELELQAGLSADEVLQEAESEAARVERELYVIAKQLWFKQFPNAPLPADDAAGRRRVVAEVLAKIGEDRSTPETLLADTKKTVDGIRTFIRDRQIITLPEPDRCEIIEMPEFQRGYSVAYMNNAPPLDPNARSFYAVSPPLPQWSKEVGDALLKEYNHKMLQILTIHEAYPGHYVQIEYANRNPSLVRKVLADGTFIEGWAVYTEQMMLDQGYGNGDLALRTQQLKFYLRAVLNAILDHKMHCTGMTDDEAKELLMVRGFQTEGEALGKIQRAKQQSGQLSTYFVGRTAFYRVRQKIQRERGDKFDLGKFHEAVLSHGSVPVVYLPELVK